MSKISQLGYLFAHTGQLDNKQVESCLQHAAGELSSNFNIDISDLEMIVNVVMNKEGKKFGHTYIWVSKPEIFHAFCGKNFDGSSRIEMIDDPDWEPPSEDEDEAIEAADGDWGAMDDIEQSYECPKITKQLPPLVSFPAIKYTPQQLKEVEGESQFGFIEVFEVQLSKKIGKLNTIFSNNIPDWITHDILFNYFEKFERDKKVYQDKRTKEKYRYPQIMIKQKRDLRELRTFCNITFSPLHRETATFLINISKRVNFEHKEKNVMLFFSQSKSKDYQKNSP